MKTRAVRLYGENDLRLEEFELPPLNDGDILIKIVSDSVCMSTYKTVKQGSRHIRVPNDIAQKPVIVGHEFCARIEAVTDKWSGKYRVGEKVIMPPALSYLEGMQTIGYSFGEIGGDATYCIVRDHMIEHGYLIKLESDAYFSGSLIEPVSCVVRGYKGSLHLDDDLMPYGNIKPGGKTVILAGCGPMGLAAIDVALHGPVKPALLLVTDIDAQRLARAKELFDPSKAAEDGITLIFSDSTDSQELLSLSENTGFDDVFVYTPHADVVELADKLLAFDGCLNFFAGPLDKDFSAKFNFYNAHYQQHHVSGTSGSTIGDIHDVVEMLGKKQIDPAVMITHIGGLNATIDTTLHLPEIPGGKKLIYPHISLPLTAIDSFAQLGKEDSRFAALADIVSRHNGLWCAEAEAFLLDHFSEQ